MANCSKCKTGLRLLSKEKKNQKECMDTCKSWFAANPVLRAGCCCACTQNANIRYGTKDDYLCGNLGPEDRDLIKAFGLDYCSGNGFDLDNYAEDLSKTIDPSGDNERILSDDLKDASFRRSIGYAAVALIFLMIAGILILKLK